MSKAYIFLACLLLIGSLNATWFNTSWHECIPFNITNAGEVNLTNYVIEIYFDLNENKTNGTDLRFIWKNGTTNQLQYFWRETCSENTSQAFCWNYSTASGAVWMNATSILNQTEPTQYYACYNASDVEDVSNGTNTFSFFSDCSGASVSTAEWNNIGAATTNGNGICDFSTMDYSNSTKIMSKKSMTGTNWSYLGRTYLEGGNYLNWGTQLNPMPTYQPEWGLYFQYSSGFSGGGYNGTKNAVPNGTISIPSQTWHREKATANHANSSWAIGNFSTAPQQTDNNFILSIERNVSFGHYTFNRLIYVDWVALARNYEYPLTITYGDKINTGSYISINQTYPKNMTYANTTSMHFEYDVNFTETWNTAVELYLNGVLNQTNSTDANKTFTIDRILVDGNYWWYVYAYNQTRATENSTTSDTLFFTIDTTAPSSVAFANVNDTYFHLNETLVLNFNETNFGGCNVSINGTLHAMNQTNSTSCSYLITDGIGNFTLIGYVWDLANNTAESPPIMLRGFNCSLSIMATNPLYDLIGGTANLTVETTNYFGAANASMTYNGIYFATPNGGYNFTASLSPYGVSTPTEKDIVYSITFNEPSVTINISKTINESPYGIMLCGGSINTSTINWSVFNSQTFEQINNSTFTITVNQTVILNKISTFTDTNMTFSLCMFPSNGSSNSTITETISSPGYFASTSSRLNAIYTGTTTYFTIFLTNSSNGKQTIVRVIDNNRAPMPNVFVKISQQNTTSNIYYTLGTYPTNINGETTQILIPATTFYQFSVLDSLNNTLASFDPSIIACGTYDTICYVYLSVATSVATPYVSTFEYANASCTWNNATGYLTCTPTSVANTLASTNLSVALINSTTFNQTVCTETGTNSSAVTCILPITAGNCYNFVYSAIYTSGETPILAGGQVCVSGKPTFTDFGGIGVLMTFILIGFGAILGMSLGASGACIGASFGIMVAVALSFVTGIAWFGAIGGIALLWIMAWICK